MKQVENKTLRHFGVGYIKKTRCLLAINASTSDHEIGIKIVQLDAALLHNTDVGMLNDIDNLDRRVISHQNTARK